VFDSIDPNYQEFYSFMTGKIYRTDFEGQDFHDPYVMNGTVEVTTTLDDTVTSRLYEVAVRGEGTPVIWFPGMPIGALKDYYPRHIVLQRIGARIIGLSRPGYGASTPEPGRMVRDAARWVEETADALGIDKFRVFGRSAGAAHALACAALLPDRVEKAAVLMSGAPRNADGITWEEGMSHDNNDALNEGNMAGIREKAKALASNRFAILDGLKLDSVRPLPNDDYRALGGGIEELVARAHAGSVRNRRIIGWEEDAQALGNPDGWGFDVEKIECSTLLIGEEQDPYAPVAHTEWLARKIKKATLFIGTRSHFESIPLATSVLAWLITNSPADEQDMKRLVSRGVK
jgi:pimeloyl-ACP methyl ester carboxylesterase